MECDICFRGYDAKRLPFLCAVDARNQIYQGRINTLQLLFENEKLQNDVDHVLTDSTKPTKDALDLVLAQQRLAEDRTDQILAAADKLREEIQAARDEVKARKSALARRKSDLASVSDGLLERRARQQHEVDKSTQMLRFRWSQSAQDLARTRAFLCNEAVRLYGLKRTKKGSTGRYDYHIGRVPVVDLTSMDILSPEAISTSLAHVAHILMLVSHYLAIRLPAEITLPHRDFPQPTIFNLAGSYQHGPVAFPNGSNITPSLQTHDPDSHHVPRPRPLFVDKPLPQLSKEDPATYSFFLEGVTLLAYDIAWLCSTQGVSIGDKGSFEDMCHMGRNLYNLLLGAQMQGYTNLSVKAVGRRDLTQDEAADNWIGRYSHGSMYYYLGGVEGTEFIRRFKLPSPMKLADRLKKKLLGDAHAADWEVLDDDAWRVDEVPNDAGGGAKGSNGWTKVKHRT
ncbi:vacuolar sorting and autophagy-related subunit [Hirsutella rhossiliensis]|uniref:Autophagy-related protein 14 n=1 Tax=Hirsutella rhossiliensis TaxID=111463 RepID=A0A9P8SHR1_9HYPO|nr:vacuolar sorting and autophagy-related subunit [Hirsutella rhossiliensis]KAH0962419.1 vacuolar sorting and autophagy-related subunit [Hirsutella rhossiliensis]